MKKKVRALLGYSWNEVSAMFWQGRIEQEVWDAYNRVWNWIGPRMGGAAGVKHDLFYVKNGAARYYAKINKTRRIFGFNELKF